MSTPTGAASSRHRRDVALGVVWLIALLVAFGTLSVLRHMAYNSHAYDLGLQHHVVWNTFKGAWFRYTYMVGFSPALTNHLGDHVQLILLPISWLYLLHEAPETLLIVQVLVVASGIVPLFLLGRLWLKRDGPALLLACLYVLHPGIQGAVLFDFHPETLAGSFLLWACYFFETRRSVSGWTMTLLLLSCKENVALTVALFGGYWLLRRRWRLGLGLMLVGSAWFALCYFWILPHYNPAGGSNAFTRYQYLGPDWAAVLVRIVTDPRLVWRRMIEPLSMSYLAGLWAPLGGLSLLSPSILLVAASEMGLNILSSFDAQRTIDYQYSVVVIAVSALAACSSAAWLSDWFARAVTRWRSVIWIPWTIALFAAGASLAFQVNRYDNLRLLGQGFPDTYVKTQHDRLGDRFISQIPASGAVSAQSDLAPHVSCRTEVYVFPTVNDAEYVLLDATSTTFPVHLFPIGDLTPEEAYVEYVRRLLVEESFVVVDAEDGWLLLARGTAGREGSAATDVSDVLSALAERLGLGE